MTKHYQPPTVEDDPSECNPDHDAPQSDGNLTAFPLRDRSPPTSSPPSSPTSPTSSYETSSDSGSETNSRHTAPNPIDVQCWTRILQLYEEYQHSRSPSRRCLASPIRSHPPKRRPSAPRQQRASHVPEPTVPLKRSQALKRCASEWEAGEENSHLARVKRALLDDPVRLGMSCQWGILSERGW